MPDIRPLTKTISKTIPWGLLIAPMFITPANATSLAQGPLYLTASQPPLVMLTMARDHKLYYEAYNDYSDLDGDGIIEQFYKPSIDYLGNFDSYKCYDYSGGIFTPVAITANKKCTGANDGYWSGDFLNYLTTSRIDALRKVFYGGKRSTDTTTQTILERSFIPQDAHSWGKEYTSVAYDGYDIREYTPLSLPVVGYRHIFANVTLTSDTSRPLLRVLNDSKYRVWEWLSIEQPVAGDKCLSGNSGPACATSAGTIWSIVPASNTNGLSNMTQTTYNTAEEASPTSQSAFDSMEVNYGTLSRRCGTGSISSINGSGNPFTQGAPTLGTCSNDNYMTVFTGTLNTPTAATYTFGIDGDDAIDLFIDGTQRIGWYGGHGKSSDPSAHSIDVTLAAGTHTIKFRHHERTGEDNYYLYEKINVPASAITDYNVRVEVCKTIPDVGTENNRGRESNCQGYGTSPIVYKPTGLLHKYGQNNGMYFGLITGSYDKNTKGGILRKEVSSIVNEIESSTGSFKESGTTCGESGTSQCVRGVIGTIDRLKITGFSPYSYSCGWITNRQINDGECEMWGNPLGEMMYEGLRYFTGKTSATSDFVGTSTKDDGLGLPKVTWGTNTDPYGANNYPSCAKPYFMLVSDVYPSFDSDQVPGSYFGGFAGDITEFSTTTTGQNIWEIEFGSGVTKNIFIGQSAGTYDGAPTVKSAGSFGNIRGLAPGEPTRQGSYSVASVAYFAKTHDINTATGNQKASTYSIALAPALPKIEILVGGKKVSLVPFAKSVGGSSISATQGDFQPTDQIVDFYVETINNTTAGNTNAAVNEGRPYYKFRINYEDVEQGADHDMDAIATYEVRLNANNTISVSLSSDYAAGGIIQHMGYVISGTTADGVYLEVRDVDTSAGSDPDYFLDTPNTSGAALPLSSSRTFTPSSNTTAGTLLEDPLWYAAKFGGFSDANSNNIPESTEWDADGDGVPDNYFLVVNPLKMQTQMDKAMAKISDDSGTSASLSTNSYSLQSGTLIYQSRFRSGVWSGELNAYPVTSSGLSAVTWQAQQQLATASGSSRTILTYDVDKTSGRGIPFQWDSMTNSTPMTLRTSLNKNAGGTIDNLGSDRTTFLRGDDVTGMRTRPTITGTTTVNRLGDIVNSQAQFVGKPNFGYGDASYALFSNTKANRTKMLYVGANDGMLHGFNALTGVELLAYVPSEMYRTRSGVPLLSALTRNDYGKATNPHHYYVDGTPTFGDICTGSCAGGTGADTWKTILVGGLSGGGQGIYALDITNPSNFSEANASSIVKWEFLDHDHDGNSTSATITGDSELGYTYSRPYIVKLCTERDNSSSATPKFCSTWKWYVVFGNGYHNTEADGYRGTGDAALYILDADTGYLVKKIALNETDAANPNGLSEVAPIDIDADGTVDYIYGGDLKGNLWRIDFTSDNTNSWATAFGSSSDPLPLYVAMDEQSTPARQPITTAPDVILHPSGGVVVIFGTGSYIANTDPSTTQVQSIYGVWDKMSGSTVSSTSHSSLQQQTVNSYTVSTGGESYRTVSSNPVAWEGAGAKDGWYINLPESKERIVFNPQILGGGILKFTSTIPSGDACEAGGTGWDYYVDALTGARLQWSAFNAVQDMLNFGGTSAYASARKSNVGITPSGTLLIEGQGIGTIYQGGSNGEMDSYKANLGQAVAGRISWREILND
ncbi:PilC/PilY family type IV pilus protein [Propionivibrio limicola]|uniref:PilC/PilY family type IV pilus protein n=1 Tax=Propionivibrio limicola TaxID=167645 RepID=UPI001291367A|nr:PilC/PilY family type IV pilus protein [Propionivibrio limicola]